MTIETSAVTGPVESDYLHPTKTNSFAAYLVRRFLRLRIRLSLQGAARIELDPASKGDTDALGFFRPELPRRWSFAGWARVQADAGTHRSLSTSRMWSGRTHPVLRCSRKGPHDTSKTFECSAIRISVLEESVPRWKAGVSGVKYQNVDGSTASVFDLPHHLMTASSTAF
jgi:hypothetical protein